MSTLNGVGTFYYGADDRRDDGSQVATLWVVLFFFPLFPLGTYRIKKGAESASGETLTQQIEVVEKLPLRWGQCACTLAKVWLGVPIILFAPVVLLLAAPAAAAKVFHLDPNADRWKTFLEGALFLGVAWVIFGATWLLGRARRG